MEHDQTPGWAGTRISANDELSAYDVIEDAREGDGPATGKKWNDANMRGDFTAPEAVAVLNSALSVTPERLGPTWNDVRTAPSTPERDAMGYQSLRPAQRALMNIFENGQVTLNVEDELVTFDLEDGPMRLPKAGLRAFLTHKGDSLNADDGDPIKIMHSLFGEEIGGWPTVEQGRGSVVPKDGLDVRWIEFPPRAMVIAEIERRFGRVVG